MTEIFMNDDLLPFEDEESIYLATLIAQREALSVAPLAKMDDGSTLYLPAFKQPFLSCDIYRIELLPIIV
jgi:hypothetical protein